MMESQEGQLPTIKQPTFTVAHQKVHLEVNFNQLTSGRTEITIYPDSPDLREISLHGRQCTIRKILVNDFPPSSVLHQDPCDQHTLHANASVHQYHLLADKIARSVGAAPEPDIIITLPKKLRIVPVEVAEVHTQTAGTIKITDPQTQGASAAEVTQALTDTTTARFTPLTVVIEFESCHAREGLQFSSGRRGSGRWPHAYTRSKLASGGASSLFPCVDTLGSRCTWDVSIKCPRTVGDAIAQALSSDSSRRGQDAVTNDTSRQSFESKEMVVVCSGELTDEILDRHDSTSKTVSFSCSQQLAPQQIGFAIGPFDKINLSEMRDAQQAEDIGRNAVEMLAYCSPGRAEETKNTCLPTTMAMDYVVQKYISCPVKSYAMCFVEDAHTDTTIFAGLTICSTRLLYPEEVIDPAQDVTRILVHAIVSQWLGVNIIATSPQDTWVIVGSAYFITNLFMRELSGNNEYRAFVKQQADKIVEMDHGRPSIYDLGSQLHVDPSAYEFLAIKAAVVLFILDRRIAKSHGTSKMPGILGKILTRARTGDLENNTLSTESFQKITERIFHEKIDEFLAQWVKGTGCPRFFARQRFNKKKLVVEMTIQQEQNDRQTIRDLDPESFMREVHESEDFHDVYAYAPPKVFTGPMTIRIHEADGTPYEHIVQIKDASTTFEVPYNTKYKRLKRSKKQRARANNKAIAEQVDEENDALVYCLGDVLQSEEEIIKWRIQEWTQEEEDKMNMESYEWIRLDADFEWICAVNLAMPGYMYVSQLQQDRDVVAHLESIRTISRFPPHPTMSSIIVRTLMDRRYFHGVRQLAAKALVRHAAEEVNNVGLHHLKKAFEELFCVTDRGSTMTRPNDFSDQLAYMVKCEIVEAIANVRNGRGHTPKEVRDFLLDKLKFNDNSVNDYSDAHYVARLMKALTSAAIARPHYTEREVIGDFDLEDEVHELKQFEGQFLEEIDRYRRMDEWTSSYQNLYSRTALECQAMLAAAGIGTFSPLHFLQYTRPGNYDMLRRSAYTVLVSPRIFDDPAILQYVLYCMVADPSPYIRQSLQHVFGVVFGRQAIGDSNTAALPVAAEGLVIEGASHEEEDLESRRAQELARRQNTEAAVKALKEELGSHEVLQTALWNAICYDQITLEDLQTLLDYCRLLYDPVYEMKVSLRLPRYWKVQSLGKGKLKFSESRKVRSKPMPKWHPPAPLNTLPPPIQAQSQPSRPAVSAVPAVPKLKLNFGKQSLGGGIRQPSISLSNPSPTPPPPPQSASQPVSQRQSSFSGSQSQRAHTPVAAPQKKITLKIGAFKNKGASQGSPSS